jgi:hypothetical protein
MANPDVLAKVVLLGVGLYCCACRSARTGGEQAAPRIPSFCGQSAATRVGPHDVALPPGFAPLNQTIVSRVPSLRVDVLGTSSGTYVLALRNLSSSGVMAIAWNSRNNEPSIGFSTITGSNRADHRPIIAARETCSEFVSGDPSLVLAAAIFTDGSNEGDPGIAAELRGRQEGYQSQRGRIHAFMDPIVGDNKPDDDAKIARIRDGLMKLSGKPDERLVREMRVQFPDLGNDTAVQDLQKGYEAGTQAVWTLVWEYEHRPEKASGNGSLGRWLAANWP